LKKKTSKVSVKVTQTVEFPLEGFFTGDKMNFC